jgi:hypothetical protein
MIQFAAAIAADAIGTLLAAGVIFAAATIIAKRKLRKYQSEVGRSKQFNDPDMLMRIQKARGSKS